MLQQLHTVWELNNKNGGVAVTLAQYETPNRNNMNKRGVPVDVELGERERDACGQPNDPVVCVYVTNKLTN